MSTLSIFDAYETDLDAEENGKWFTDFLGEGSGADIKLRRANSTTVEKVRQRVITANRKHFVKGKFPKDVQDKIDRQIVAEAIIVDWRGINDREGNEIKFDPETAIPLLEKLPNFMRDIVLVASSMEAFRTETREEIVGN